MVKVFFDHQKFSEQKFGGITRYFSALIDAVKADPDFDYRLGALYSNNHYIRNEDLLLNNALGRWIFKRKPRRIYKWNKQYSKYLIGKNDFDVLHPTYFHPYFLKRTKKPYVMTMHDMIYEALPEYFTNTEPLPYQKKITTGNASAVIAISESTRQDLIKYLDVPPEKIRMIHHGLDLKAPLPVEKMPGLPENYILFVGERGNYKNFFRFVEAGAELLQEFKDLHLVFAGGGPFQVADSLAVQRLGIQARCLQFDVNDAQLNYLYQQARVFVFPSLYEGFGYPLLEAFKNGCPIAASDASCFPEIGGDAVSYFNPYDQHSIYTVVRSVLSDSTSRNSLISKGSERLKLFPIEKQQQATLDLYREVAGK